MSEETFILLGTKWGAFPSQHNVNNLTIVFDKPHTCTVTFMSGGKSNSQITCNYAMANNQATSCEFGITGGSVSLLGGVDTTMAVGQAQGFAADVSTQAWALRQQSS